MQQDIGFATGSVYCLIPAISISLSVDRGADISLGISWGLWED